MIDLGIEALIEYPAIAYYGRIWHVEFRDWTTALVIEDETENFVLEPEVKS